MAIFENSRQMMHQGGGTKDLHKAQLTESRDLFPTLLLEFLA